MIMYNIDYTESTNCARELVDTCEVVFKCAEQCQIFIENRH